MYTAIAAPVLPVALRVRLAVACSPMQVLFLCLVPPPSLRLSVLACNDAEVEVVEPEPPAPPRGTPTPPILAVAKASLHDFDVLALVGKVRGVCAAL